MLSITTQRHQMFVCIPGMSGDSRSSIGGIGEVLDTAVDRLLAMCQADGNLRQELMLVKTMSEGQMLIRRHLKASTPNDPWMRSGGIGASLCSRVLYLMHPDRFGFEKYGWIH